MMYLTGVIFALLSALNPNAEAQMTSDDTFYLLAVTSQTVGGTTETFCITLKSHVPVSLEVTLDSSSLLKEVFQIGEYYKCVPFQVPVVHQETVAYMNIEVQGWTTVQKRTTKILITPPTNKLVIIETDKPIYKPGQSVKFRIVSLDSNFFIYAQTFPTIELQDPNSNRIGQWLNVPTQSGLVDLSYPINSEATNGVYVITVWDENNVETKEIFEVREYVMPTFNVSVQIPSFITVLDTSATLTVCARYTYGKPLTGTVKTEICQNGINYWWIRPLEPPAQSICRNYTMQTDKTGCAQQNIDLTEFALTDSRYESALNVQSEVEESGTGVIMMGSGTSTITTTIITLSFADSPTVFKPGVKYEGKIKATDANSNPVINKLLQLTVTINNNLQSSQWLITNNEGIADFSLDTKSWSPVLVSLKAQVKESQGGTATPDNNLLSAQYPAGFLNLQPFYSKSGSLIELVMSSAPFSCDKTAKIEARYVIRDDSCKPFRSDHGTLSLFYMVMSKGHLFQHGRLALPVSKQAENTGGVSLSLENVNELSPVAQVVVYTLLSNGEVVADSMNFPVEPCLNNEVSLNFTSPSEVPGDPTSLILKAAPGSLCSLRAIDRSLLLLKPQNELSIESMFSMLPFKTLSGYPFSVFEVDTTACQSPTPLVGAQPQFYSFFPIQGKVDVYNIFKDIGIKILTNADIRNPSACYGGFMSSSSYTPQLSAVNLLGKEGIGTIALSVQTVIRKYFPETWIWDLVPVSDSGEVILNETVPDSITTWQADAFCTSPIGFGVAPKTELTAFKPFFTSLTMPSSVIQGETFTLKATVFNYLQSCMTVAVNLADSTQFSATLESISTFCLCADEEQTVSWTITPEVLEELTFTVTAQAVESPNLCGDSAVSVPQNGHADTIEKTLLVRAEGTKETKTYNSLLCTSEGISDAEVISLTLPDVVDGSVKASVSVLGDLMGRALKNLASLLAMPYGCGEQNMLRFAPNIFILEYLESTNQLTPAVRSTAETYLVSGYQQELTYKHDDGSYSAFGNSDTSGNTWLTAFVMKSFGQAKKYIFVDQVFVDQAKTWLGKQQQANGCFASVGQLFHSDLKGGVNDEVSLTAYVTSAMLELNYPVTDPVVNRSLECLRNASAQVDSTYTKALLFYTFTLAGDEQMKNTLFADLNSVAISSGVGTHWSRENDGSVTDSLEVEMTSYVLLALLSGSNGVQRSARSTITAPNMDSLSSIVKWLSKQQSTYGGFASTQDTVVALEALTKYSLTTYSPARAITLNATPPSGQPTTFNINQSNRLLYQENQLQEVPGDYTITAEGEGCVYVQFTLQYNIPTPEPSSTFVIDVSTNCVIPDTTVQLTISVLYFGDRPQTNMVLIEVQPLSGYSVDEMTVKLVDQNSALEAVKRVEQRDGKTIIYVDGLMKDKLTDYTLTMLQDVPVQNLKPALLKVYDYYQPGDMAESDYKFPCIDTGVNVPDPAN